MNTIFIVLPILTLLMFELGLELNIRDFLLFYKRPRPVFVGLVGQIVVLPLLAIGLGLFFRLDALFFVGLVLIACSPGGSSSNVFSMIAKGDVALSVSLTALSSVITLFTIPVIMAFAFHLVGNQEDFRMHLPVGRLIIQNLVLTLLPVVLGVLYKRYAPERAEKVRRLLNKIAFPALLLLATVFFVQHYRVILVHIGQLGVCIGMLILSAMAVGGGLSWLMRLQGRERRTIVIEIGMQNAAQGIAIATSPFIFNSEIIAIPSIVYALIMNIVLLTYIRVAGRTIQPVS
ncbi:bile acid:sodium symporter family protein [Culturomica sp.]|uniref:bile acid:sodium symporter family protein n=1 Tax=Culturomica sp. TaxID=1926652 RepID=UPI000E7DAAD4|nr:bile acid:sodium symporter family protein [Culturomica sp.]HBO26568.1 bile acid transporter [Culturomica sp.]